MIKVITIAVIITAILVFLYFTKNQKLKAKARQCAKEAQRFHEKLQQLSDPAHLFTDDELHQLKREFAPLLNTVNQLYDNPFISKEYLNKLGLRDFIDERQLVNHMQYKNNQLHH